MSDRQMFGNRKYLLLVIPILLLLAWFVFSPGGDQKKDRTDTTNTSQKTSDRKDSNQEQKPNDNEGRVDAANTTTPSPTPPIHKPRPKIITASAVKNTPSTAPPQTPPANNEENPPAQGPVCITYENQVIRLAPGSTTTDCYILKRSDNSIACWIPHTYLVVTNEGTSIVTKEEESVDRKPLIVIENANAFAFDNPDTFACPVRDNHLQFRVHAPVNVLPNEQPGVAYDYQLKVDSVGPPKDPADTPSEDGQTEVIPEVHADVTVDIAEEESAGEPEVSALPELPADSPSEQLPTAG